MRTLRTPLLIAAALALAACNGSGDTAPPETGDMTNGESGSVAIVDNDYDPADIEVSVGDTVAWNNTGDVAHTVTFDDEDSGIMDPGETYSRTFDGAGEFAYTCTIHPTMEGTVTVTG